VAENDNLQNANELKTELRRGASTYKFWARCNYILAYVFTTIAVAASVSATILVAGGVKPGSEMWIAILAAIPALVLVATSAFRFESKSAWHWRKTRAYQSLYRQLKYEGKEAADVSAHLSKIDLELDEDWIPFGKITGNDNS